MNKRITAVLISVMLGMSTAACANGGEASFDSAAAPAGSEEEIGKNNVKEEKTAGALNGDSGEDMQSEDAEDTENADSDAPDFGDGYALTDMDPELMQAMQEAFLGAVFSEATADGLSKDDYDLAQKTMNSIADSAANGEDVSDKDISTLGELIDRNRDNKLISSYYSAANAIDLINDYMNADEDERAQMNDFLDVIMDYALESDAGSGGAYSRYIRKYLEGKIGEQNFRNLCIFYTGFRQTYGAMSDNGKKMTRTFVKGTVQRCNDELTDDEWESVNGAADHIPGVSKLKTLNEKKSDIKKDGGKDGKDQTEKDNDNSDMKLTPETVDLFFDLMDSGKLDPILLVEE